MKHLNKSEFARYVSVGEASVRRAIKKGEIVLEQDGLINPNRPENENYRLTKQLDPTAGVTRSTPKETIESKTNPQSDVITELRIKKELASIRKIELENEKKRGNLIDRKTVAEVFNRLYSVQQSEFIPIANKIMPEVASILGTEDNEKIAIARSLLESELWKALGSMKRSIQEFLTEHE